MNIKKSFPAKGNMQLFKLVELKEFNCAICKKDKKSKNVVIMDGDESKVVCNGCYGQRLKESEGDEG